MRGTPIQKRQTLCGSALTTLLLAAELLLPPEGHAQRQERLALSAHAELGLGGRMERDYEPPPGASGGTGFEEFEDLLIGGYIAGPLNPSPGLGLRLTVIPRPHVSLALAVQLSSLRASQGVTVRFADVGLALGWRLPLALGARGRLVTPYLAVPFGLSTMEDGVPAGPRRWALGFHAGALAGIEVEVARGVGLFVEAGFTQRRVRGEQWSFASEPGRVTVTTSQGVLHLGLRVAL